MRAEFDCIVVGAGAAGCVLANRLTQDPKRSLLLLEAGRADRHPLIHIPRGFGWITGNPAYVWQYEVSPHSGAGPPELWIRGKGLGGSSSVNGMVYVRGVPQDYEDWGCEGWRWSDMLRSFRAIENHELGPSPMRGAEGPLKVTQHPGRQVFCDAVIAAAGRLGLVETEDLNAGEGPRIGYHQRTIWHGWRQSAAVAFLRSVAARPNLTIMSRARVDRILFDGRRAIGVELHREGQLRRIRAREIIVAAGTLNSPKLLQLSGIGPAEHLRKLGIPVVFDSPQVGCNFREHRLILGQFKVRHGSNNREFHGWRFVRNALRYGLARDGLLSYASIAAGGFFKSRASVERPDCQLLIVPVTREIGKRGFSIGRAPGVSCGGYVMRPESQGTVMITSSDPAAPPAIDPNFLSEESDRRASIGLFRFIRRLFDQPELCSLGASEIYPGADVESDDEIVDAFRRFGNSGYHGVGTCRMGEDEGSVVDTKLRIRGVEGLRVIDLSVMPKLISGNTNGPTMALAWRAAELIEAG